MERVAVERDRWRTASFDPLKGIVAAPIAERILVEHARVWDGRGDTAVEGPVVLVADGRIAGIMPAPPADFAGRRIDGTGTALVPGFIDSHVHMMWDSGAEMVTRPRDLMRRWFDEQRRYAQDGGAIVRRGQLRLKAGVTTMRILGDGLYSLAYRDDVAAWRRVGPRILTAGLHVNGPDGYVSGGLGKYLTEEERAEAAVELRSIDEVEPKVGALIDRGIDVVKIASTHGDLGFADAEPDLPVEWIRRIVDLAHARGLRVACHSYGDEGDWAAINGGVDSIEHLVNVPHALPEAMIAAIVERGISVCPTLAGSAYSVHRFLEQPGLLSSDPDLIANVPAPIRSRLKTVLRVMKLPGFTRFVMRQPGARRKWDLWYEWTLRNTAALHAAGVDLVFGTDVPFVFGNFWHSIMNEVRGLSLAGIGNLDILKMATSGAARAIGLADVIGTIEPGKSADLVLLAGDPLVDLEAIGRVALVIKEGRVVYQAARG